MTTPAPLMTHTAKCANCSAPLEITPDAIAYVCKYCGHVGAIDGAVKKDYLMVTPLAHQSLHTSSITFLKKDLGGAFQEAYVKEEKLSAVPFWIADVIAESTVNGYSTRIKTETYTVPGPRGQMQTRTRSYTVYVPVHEELQDHFIFVHPARKHVAFYGLDEISDEVRAAQPKPLDPVPLLKEKMEFLDVELDEDEAKETAETAAEDAHRRRAESMTSELFDCHTTAKVVQNRLVYFPIFQLSYEVKGRVFRATFDGSTSKVVKAELPMSRRLRALYLSAGYGLLVIGVLLGALLLREQFSAVGLGIAAAPGLLSAYPIFRATQSQRVKKG